MQRQSIITAIAILLIFLPMFNGVFANEVPDFTLTDIDDNEFSISSFKGKTVMLAFIATRVIFSKMLTFILINVSAQFPNDVITILIDVNNETISIGGDTTEELQKFRDECSFNGVVARDTKTVTKDFNVSYVPTLFIIDQAGYIRYKHVGVASSREPVLIAEMQNVIPEFPSAFILPTIFIFTLTAIIIYKKELRKAL